MPIAQSITPIVSIFLKGVNMASKFLHPEPLEGTCLSLFNLPSTGHDDGERWGKMRGQKPDENQGHFDPGEKGLSPLSDTGISPSSNRKAWVRPG